MNLFSFTAFIIIFILSVGAYLVFTDEVSGTIKMVLLFVLFFLGIYLVFNLSMFKRYYEVVDIPIDASVPYVYNAEKFKGIDQVYTLSTWIYVDDWNKNFGVMKNILHFERKGTASSNHATVFNLDTYENNLVVNYHVYKQPNSLETNMQTIKIPNLNIQKWVNITVCFNTNNTDTYINGKLIDTDVHQNPLFTPENKDDKRGNLILAKQPGFSGKIGLTRYYGRIISPQEAWNVYKQGPSVNLFGSLLNRYNATFTFYQDNKEVQKISLM